ncbi:MAG: hypothetical protein H6Q51_2593 [Deltaproteobacteria bacterium]|nr:hypothetical protein [Deltaproteobacteria bacterium]
MIPSCAHCRKAMGDEQPVTLMKDDCLSLFCGIRCRDKWLHLHAVQAGLESEMEIFNPTVFTYEREPVVR